MSFAAPAGRSYLTSQALTMGPAAVLATSREGHRPAGRRPPVAPARGDLAERERRPLGACQDPGRHAPEPLLASSKVVEVEVGAEVEAGQAHALTEGAAHPDAEVVETLLVVSLVAGLNAGAYLGWLWLL
ncbi:hypothetical protein GPECTOR_88g463 [Gonium pectorale]|uniref:Uncharacterized protein n=1 Tax=Gonium pectorale TaxID=33097 RepID=A0A150G2I3_GONPE|nr:hypothetical protein GPECTOR_88g463 [Gonium pectorale]|eukprot:KXZ43520.1 hypothetical protein GPECTOR_88g463 [Gonium pectorale]